MAFKVIEEKSLTFTQPLFREQDATRSIFTGSKTGLNTKFFFSFTGCLTKAKESSLPCPYLWNVIDSYLSQRRRRGAQTRQQRCYQNAGHCLKEKECLVPFVKRNAFFLLRMRHLLFLLGTSGSFCKFNSFIFLFLNLILNLFYFFIRSLHTHRDGRPK